MEEYAEAAFAAGYEVFGFCDHAPHLFGDGYVSRTRMEARELCGYCDDIRALKEKYSGRMNIQAGLEMEYFPEFFGEDIKLYRRCGVEYLILGQHSVGTESLPGRLDSFSETESPDTLKKYVDQCIAGISTGAYSYIAHPDVIHFIGDADLYKQECDRLILAAKTSGLPLEVNLLGLCGARHYPNPLFWERASALGASVVIGVDAHSPSRVYVRKEIEAGLRFVEKYKLELVSKIDTEKLKRLAGE